MDKLQLPQITGKRVLLVAIGVFVLYALYSMSGGYQGTSLGLMGDIAPSASSLSLAPGYSEKMAVDGANREYDKSANGAPMLGDRRDAEESVVSSMPPVPGSDAPAGNAKIIKNGSLQIVVADVDQAAAAIQEIRTRLKGQPGNAQFSEYTKGSRTGWITIWVPSESFDEALADIKKLALRTSNENVSVSDVSAQYVDLEARLKNARATEAQYVEIMKRSGTIPDVLQVTRELSNVRNQIEQLQGQLNYLSRQIALSSITITLSQEVNPAEVKDEWRPLTVVKIALKQTLAELTGFIDSLLVLLIKLPVFLLQLAFWVLVVWVIWRFGRFAYAKVKAQLPPSLPPKS